MNDVLKASALGVVLFLLMMFVGTVCMAILRLTPATAEKVMFPVFGLLVWQASRWQSIRSWSDGVRSGLIWLAVYAMLDYLIIVRVIRHGDAGGYYRAWTLWVWYGFLVAIPSVTGALHACLPQR